jgi:3'-5' exoribonuclease
MVTFNEFLKLADRIKNKELRRKVLSLIKNPKLDHRGFKAAPADFREVPASTNFHHIYVGGLLDHTYAVTAMSIAVAEVIEKAYNAEIDYDSLIAAAMVHDIGKLWKMKKESGLWSDTEIKLDHTMLGTAELYARGFPESVIHIVSSHFGPEGPTPPATIEAIIFHNVDNFDANIGTVDQNVLLQQILNQINQEKQD